MTGLTARFHTIANLHRRTGSGSLLIILPIILLVFATPVSARTINQYPFADNTALLADATHFPSWAATLQRQAEQQSLMVRCRTEAGSGETMVSKAECRGRLRSYNRMIAKAAELTREEKITLVNYYINRTRYDRDHPERLYDEQGKRTGVKKNHWATLYEFLTERGDCEDYASAKYFMLRELGFPPDDMRIVVTYETRPRGYHAVLALRVEQDKVWLLESDNVIKKRNHSGYRYIYAMNEHSVWDHRTDY
ncbi:MAG: transglutaminase-like cysteine peptidase [Pseudomonadota bacterium]